ncbi:MAG: L-threonylcarbamoyladenylate synthase [Marinilabiliaceae bacterium]|nr:L-threonylcarbamoyladenylate synthase [Marinilabiliaceae bacterium]
MMLQYSKEDINNSLDILHKGGVILYPTDTIWGLGCDATKPQAVEKVYRIKNRVDSKSMLVLIHNENMLKSYVKEVPGIAWDLIEASIKPLTIIYPGAKNLASNLLADDGSLGIRIVNDPFCEELIRRFRKPLVSTSANLSGEKAPPFFDEINEVIKEAADYVVNYRRNDMQPREASSIIKLDLNGVFKILR